MLTTSQTQGRNMWLVWTGGNDRLWDVLNWKSYGIFDLLKTISSNPNASNPNLKFGRPNRWQYLGVVNEPCFEEATGPDPDRFLEKSSWLTDPVTYASSRSHFLFLMRNCPFYSGHRSFQFLDHSGFCGPNSDSISIRGT